MQKKENKNVWKRISEVQCRSCSMTARPRYCLNRFAYLFSRELWLGMQASELFRSRLELECVPSLWPSLASFQCVLIALRDNEAHVWKCTYECFVWPCYRLHFVFCPQSTHYLVVQAKQHRSHKVKYQKKAFHECINEEVQFDFVLESQACARSQANSYDAMWLKQQQKNVLIERAGKKREYKNGWSKPRYRISANANKNINSYVCWGWLARV